MARSPLGPAVPGSLAGGASEPACWAGPSLILEKGRKPLAAPRAAPAAGAPVGSRSALRAKDGPASGHVRPRPGFLGAFPSNSA